MTKCGTKAMANTMAGLRISIWSVLIAAVFALMTGMPSNAFAEPVSVKAWSSDGQIPGTLTVTTTGPGGIPTVQTFQTSGTPPKINIPDLPPGTHIIHFEGTNVAGRTEKGVMQYTVVAGAEHKVIINTQEGAAKINQAQSGVTAGNDVTNLGPAGTARNTALQNKQVIQPISLGLSTLINFQVAVAAGYFQTDRKGMNFFPQTNEGSAVSQRDTLRGHQESLRVGGATDMPVGNLGGAKTFFGLGLAHQWAEATSNVGLFTLASPADVSRIGEGSNVNASGNQVDDLDLSSEYDNIEFALYAGMKFGFGSPGNISLGNLSLGNLGAPRRNNGAFFTARAKVSGNVGTQEDRLRYTRAGTAEEVKIEVDNVRVGTEVSLGVNSPIGGGLRGILEGRLGIDYNDSSLEGSQSVAGGTSSVSDSDTSIGTLMGLAGAIAFPVGPGAVKLGAGYTRRTGIPGYELSDSATTRTQIVDGTSDEVTARAEFILPLHSDIRLKTNIERIGTLPSGLPVYSYTYAWSPKRHIGVMAQEALLLFPEAVSELDGYLAVDYSQIR